MRIITLIGPPNSGKTTAIKLLANLLLSNNGELIDIVKKNKQRSCIDRARWTSCNRDFLNHKGDITVKIRWNGMLIGITSFGDDVASIRSKYEILSNCDVFVSAAHPLGDTIDYISKIAHGKQIVITKEKNKHDDAEIAENIKNVIMSVRKEKPDYEENL